MSKKKQNPSNPMLTSGGIQWTGYTWNPTSGCTKIGAGCKNCYAEILANRMKNHPNKKVADRYRNGFKPTYQAQSLGVPLRLKKPRWIFVNSMSDLFHESFDLAYIQAVFGIMNQCTQHKFQVLTKRSERLAKVAKHLTWSDNIWMGVSVENEKSLSRIDGLRQVPTENRFLSIEPLLEAIPNLNIDGINWVIVGGESGNGYRQMRESWATPIRDLCLKEGVPFFFKQWGGKVSKSGGKVLQGRTWCEMPA